MRRTPVALVLLTLVALVSIAGCSAPAHKRIPTHHLAPVTFSGSTDGDRKIVVPRGAHSAQVIVACGGQGSFGLDGVLNTKVSGLNGGCNEGSHRYQLGVRPGQTLDVHIQLTTGALFVVETSFSGRRFVADRELASQCAAMVEVESNVFNAEQGYKLGSLSLAQWQEKIAAARTALESADGDRPNILTQTLKTMDETLAVADLVPGDFMKTSDYRKGMTIVRQICSDNGDALYVTADYGG